MEKTEEQLLQELAKNSHALKELKNGKPANTGKSKKNIGYTELENTKISKNSFHYIQLWKYT